MALLWQNVFDRELSPTRPHPSITDVRQFLANAPMDARLRNEMITRYYGHFADDLTAFVYRDGELGEGPDHRRERFPEMAPRLGQAPAIDDLDQGLHGDQFVHSRSDTSEI